MAVGGRVFDSYALLALFKGELAGEDVRVLLREAARAGVTNWIAVVNVGEIWYGMARALSRAAADEAVRDIQRLRFQIHDADLDLTLRAADLKSRYRLAFADCFAAALAKKVGTELVTGDPEFRQVEKEIRIHWLPEKRRS